MRKFPTAMLGAALACCMSVAASTTALASPCGDASRSFNRIAQSTDHWYVGAFERATGLPVASTVNTTYCPRLLPIYRERLRRQRTVLKAYRAMQDTCITLHERTGIGPEGQRIEPAPVVMQSIMTQVQMCERTLTMGHAHLDVGSRTCTNQRERCISYRQMHGPIGSEEVCVRVYRACLRSGVWDATAAFPYGGVRITGMIRR